VVQVVLTVAVVVLLPSPLRPLGLAAAAALVALALILVLVRGRERRASGRPALVRRTITDDLQVLRSRGVLLTIAVTSTGAVAGHLLVFVLAARIAGVDAPLHQLLPLAAIVLLAAGLPTNAAGWGPREGVAAWAFAAAGLGAAAGVTTAVVYGVMALVATLPGVVVLLGGYRHDDRGRGVPPARDVPILEEAARG
jgi:hypothetical protein